VLCHNREERLAHDGNHHHKARLGKTLEEASLHCHEGEHEDHVGKGVAGPHAMVPGAPKRFAQAVGLTFSASALVAELAGAHTVAVVLMVGLVMAATLESMLGLCLGCVAFSKLMSWGVIPESVCESCADISLHLSRRLEAQRS
jgi:hypothetical protein